MMLCDVREWVQPHCSEQPEAVKISSRNTSISISNTSCIVPQVLTGFQRLVEVSDGQSFQGPADLVTDLHGRWRYFTGARCPAWSPTPLSWPALLAILTRYVLFSHHVTSGVCVCVCDCTLVVLYHV